MSLTLQTRVDDLTFINFDYLSGKLSVGRFCVNLTLFTDNVASLLQQLDTVVAGLHFTENWPTMTVSNRRLLAPTPVPFTLTGDPDTLTLLALTTAQSPLVLPDQSKDELAATLSTE